MELVTSQDDDVVLRLSRDELRIVNNALNEILNGPEAIGTPEFSTRVGATRNETAELLGGLHDLV